MVSAAPVAVARVILTMRRLAAARCAFDESAPVAGGGSEWGVGAMPGMHPPGAETTVCLTEELCKSYAGAAKRTRTSPPPSGAFSASTSPPWLSAAWRTIASPRPEPVVERASLDR